MGSSFLAMFAAGLLFGQSPDAQTVLKRARAAYGSLNDVPIEATNEMASSRADATKRGLVSKAAPDFTLKDLAGMEYRLSSFRGKADRESVTAQFEAQSLPTVVVIDKGGIVRTHHVGYGDNSEGVLRAALGDAELPAPFVNTAQRTGETVYTVGKDVTPPTILSKEEPLYSEEARQAHISGNVSLSLVVGTDGLAHEIQVLRPLGNRLDENAIESVRRWKFKPGTKNGEPVAVKATIEVSFRLLDNPAAPLRNREAEAPPRTAEEAYRRGERMLRLQRVPESIALLDQAVKLNPAWAEPLAARAQAQYRRKRYDETIEDYNAAIRLDPQKAAWFDGRGLAYSYSGRQARAIEDYDRAIALNPGATVFYNNRGWAYSELGNPQRGIEDLSKAIELSPSYSKAFENRAGAYVKLQRWAAAIADYTAAMELNPTGWLYDRRAEAKQASGDTAGAEDDRRNGAELRKATPLTPANAVPPPQN